MSEVLSQSFLPDRDHRELVHDLRMRVLEGKDIAAEEMFLIVDQIRAGRRSAAATKPTKGRKSAKGRAAGKGAKTTGATASIDLTSILDQEL